jgi:hypothetical protein
MDAKTKEMIKVWIKTEGKEGAAKFISRTVICGIKEARRLVEEAVS